MLTERSYPSERSSNEGAVMSHISRIFSKSFRRPLLVGGLATVIMLSAILLANWVTTDYGFIPVGLGFEATAGTIFAGFALASRDIVQDNWGRKAIVVIILIGTLMSFAISAPEIAIASAAAFLLSEMLNFAVYTPIRARSKLGDRWWALAVSASNLAGAVADTVVFLGIAFGWAAVAPALAGQLVGKAWATLLYLAIGALLGMYLHKAAKRGTSGSALPGVSEEVAVN